MATTETVLLNVNKRHRRYTGADKFHAAGYFGERVVAATGESWWLRDYNPGGLVLDPLKRGSGTTEHPISTAAVFFQFAPKSRLVLLNMGACMSENPDRAYIRFADQSLPVIKEYNILNQFNSFTQSTAKLTNKMYEEAMNEVPNFKMFWSMGNDYSESYSRITDLECVFGIGAYRVMVSGQVIPEGFSSEAPTVDFAGPDMVAYSTSATSPESSNFSMPSGTSYSAPACCALSCLVDDFFIDKTGRPLTRENMYRFFKDNSYDIGDPGFDHKMGHGAVRLPDPASIKIEDYVDSTVDTPVIPPVEKPDENKEENIPMEEKKENYRDYYSEDHDTYTMLNIPYQSIKEIGFAQCKQPKQTVKAWYADQTDKPQIVTNGGFFDMKTGKNILSFTDDGTEMNYRNGFEGMGTLEANLASLVPGVDNGAKWKDFMSAYPVLVREGKPVETYVNATEINYLAARTAIGVTRKGGLLILTADKPKGPGMKFEDMAKAFVDAGAWFAMNLDGGGSTYRMEFGQTTNSPSEERAVDNVFYVKLRSATDAEYNPSVDLDPFVITPGTYYATTDIPVKVGVDQSEDSPANINYTIPAGGKFEVTSTMEWLGKVWAVISYDYQMGFSEMCNADTVSDEPILPAVFRVHATKELVVCDSYTDTGSGLQYHIAAKVDKDTADGGSYDVVETKDELIMEDKMTYIQLYTGMLVPDNTDPEVPDLTPGEGSNEGDGEDGKFPALYIVDPDKVRTKLNVRTKPVDGEIIAALVPNTPVTVLSIVNCNSGWVNIQFINPENGEEVTGICSFNYLTEAPAVEEPDVPSVPEDGAKPLDTSNLDDVTAFVITRDSAIGDNVLRKSNDGVLVVCKTIGDPEMFTVKHAGNEWQASLEEIRNAKIYGDAVYSADYMTYDELPDVMYAATTNGHPVKADVSLDVKVNSYPELVAPIVAGMLVKADIGVTHLCATCGSDGTIYFYHRMNGINILFDVRTGVENVVLTGPYKHVRDEIESPVEPEVPDIKPEETPKHEISDKGGMNPCYAEAVEAVISAGIMNLDEDNKFDPKGAVTREMLAQVVYNVMKKK